MKVVDFVKVLNKDFYTGVPDSQLKALCNYLMNTYGIDKKHHLICANEGNCVALAAGYHLATGKVPVVYMQNSGEGNIINPLASLINEKVYNIPEIFVIGWRGEPGVHDEPQHIYQGEVTLKLLEVMGVNYFVVTPETEVDELKRQMSKFNKQLKEGHSVAFVIKKGALEYEGKTEYKNDNTLVREEVIEHIVKYSGKDPIVSTTGKASRELFEIRNRNNDNHNKDFLTVGSMGHASSIALGIKNRKPSTRIWVVDGDGAMIMHMGSMAYIGAVNPRKFIHIVINNASHETVGGMPTAASKINPCKIAKACGYKKVYSVSTMDELDKTLEKALTSNALTFIEIKTNISSRKDLIRPTTTPIENKTNFMDYLKTLK